jgi:hypothetical protein
MLLTGITPTSGVRFVPTLPLTTQHSLAVDGQSFPRRHPSRRGLSRSFQLPFSTSLNAELSTARDYVVLIFLFFLSFVGSFVDKARDKAPDKA